MRVGVLFLAAILASCDKSPADALKAVTNSATMADRLKAGDATLSFWEAPPMAADFVAAEAGKARFVEQRQFRDGDEVVVDGRYQSFVIEHAARDMVYFQAMVRQGGASFGHWHCHQ